MTVIKATDEIVDSLKEEHSRVRISFIVGPELKDLEKYEFLDLLAQTTSMLLMECGKQAALAHKKAQKLKPGEFVETGVGAMLIDFNSVDGQNLMDTVEEK